ncbi:MAG: nucleotide exchange factor GrpE [Deltaproteobacteria bacterium]|nr:nucleotide exchange factor GrpE [Deltaproteobacteria bacterium]
MRRDRHDPFFDPYREQRQSPLSGDRVGRVVPARRPPVPQQSTRPAPDEETEQIRKAAATQRTEMKALSARYVELQQDFDRYREKQRDAVADAAREAREQMLMELAEVADDLERSIASNPDRESAWYEGNLAILQRTMALLKRHGVERLGEVGAPFDPRVHEAVGTAPSSQWADGTVIAVHRIGYRSPQRLLRPARVVVARSQ